MTEPVGRHPFAVAAWILVGALLVAGTFGVVGGILSRSFVVDLVAMWPLFALILLAGVVGWLRARKRQTRAGAILPLTIFSAVVLTAALHIGGWDELPSSEARLTGPPVDEMSDPTRLTIQIDGVLEIGPLNDGTGYRVDPILRGGDVGVPEATETFVDDDLSVRIGAAASAPAWYTFSGWRVGLSPDLHWRLILNGRLDADLRAVPIDTAAVAGSGTIRLGPPPAGGGDIVLSGDLRVVVPADAPVTVTGPATAPSDWEETDTGFESPEAGEARWRLDVRGDTPVRVSEG